MSQWGRFPSHEAMPIEAFMRVFDVSSNRWVDTSQPTAQSIMCGSTILIVLGCNCVHNAATTIPRVRATDLPCRGEDEWEAEDWAITESLEDDVVFPSIEEGASSSPSSTGPRERTDGDADA